MNRFPIWIQHIEDKLPGDVTGNLSYSAWESIKHRLAEKRLSRLLLGIENKTVIRVLEEFINLHKAQLEPSHPMWQQAWTQGWLGHLHVKSTAKTAIKVGIYSQVSTEESLICLEAYNKAMKIKENPWVTTFNDLKDLIKEYERY